MNGKIVLISCGLLLIPVVASAKPGDIYRKSGGPKVDVERVKRPSAMGFCKNYRLSTADMGKVKKSADPQLFNTCKAAVLEARKAADEVAGSRGLEDGYLRGYAWGLKKGIRRGKRDKGAEERGKTAAFESAKVAQAIQDATTSGKSLGGGDADAKLTKEFKSAFAAGRMPTTKYRAKDVKVPTPKLLANPAKEYYGALPSTESILEKKAKAPTIVIPGSTGRVYFRGRTYKVLSSFSENGVHPFNWQDAVKSEQGWAHWNATGGEAVETHKLNSSSMQSVFEKTFKSAYKSYARYFYSSKFYRSLDVGAKSGYSLGKKGGQQHKYFTSFRRHVNETYRAKVPKGFEDAYLTSYKKSFEAFIAAKKAAPILTVTEVTLDAAVADGIVAPGEGLLVTVKAENRGLKSASLPVEIRGPVTGIQPAWVEVPAFKKITSKTKVIAKVEPALEPGKKVTFNVTVNDQGYPAERQIRQILEVQSISMQDLDPLGGKGTVAVVLKNPTTKASPAKGMNVKLLVDASKRAEVPVTAVKAGGTKSFTLKFASVDPLSLIDGTTSDVELYAVAKRMHGKSRRVDVDEPESTLMSYFDALAYGDAFVPPTTAKSDQIGKARELLISKGKNQAQNAKGNPWKKSPRETLLGLAVEHYETATGSAKAHYSGLVGELCKFEKDVGRTKQKAYRDLCSRLIAADMLGDDETDEAELLQKDGSGDPVGRKP